MTSLHDQLKSWTWQIVEIWFVASSLSNIAHTYIEGSLRKAEVLGSFSFCHTHPDCCFPQLLAFDFSKKGNEMLSVCLLPVLQQTIFNVYIRSGKLSIAKHPAAGSWQVGDGEKEKSSYGVKSATTVPKNTLRCLMGLLYRKRVWCLELANETCNINQLSTSNWGLSSP